VGAPAARLFSNPAGMTGRVNERVGRGTGGGGGAGGHVARPRTPSATGGAGSGGWHAPKVMQQLLRTTEHIVQEIDSVEDGLTDIQVRHPACPGAPGTAVPGQ